MQRADLYPEAQKVLQTNDTGLFTKPAPNQYPHQWNWDSALIALGLSHYNLPRALLEIRSLLRGQWRDGMVPHILYPTGPSHYFPTPDFWQITKSPNAPGIPTSGLTQPPLLATIIRRIHTRTPISDFIREVYPAVFNWHRWLHTARDADGSGLVCIIHPWESGTDDSPRWLQVLGNIYPPYVPQYQRRDTVHVASGERPSNADYDRFMYLIDVFRRNQYDPSALLAQSPFLVQDVLFNAILYRANQDLRALALDLGESPEMIEGWLAKMQEGFDRHFWDEQRGLYFDYDVRNNASIPVNTAMTFMPLYAGVASKHQAHRLVTEHWLNPAEYAPNTSVRYRITTTSQAEPTWEARRYWRGPIWIILNWLLEDGLRQYGYHEFAEEILRDSLKLIMRAGFWEYYDPRDGSGCGSPNFSWTAALAIDWLATKSLSHSLPQRDESL